VDDRILTFDPDEKDRARAFVERGFMPPGTKRYKDKRFMFDRVFNHEARQQDVYEATSQPLLKGVFDGYNATVFAYGVSPFYRSSARSIDLNSVPGHGVW
jgi:kinesin family protein 18/19